MATFAPWTAAMLAASFDFSSFGRVADIGGGNGTLLIGVLQACPKLTGIVFDQPHATEQARRQIAAAGLANRCEVVCGNFFEQVPCGADAYLLCHVLVDWDDERADAILLNCRAAMPKHAKLLIVEEIYPPRIEASSKCYAAAANDVLMLVCTGGYQRSQKEFQSLLERSQFRLAEVTPLGGGASLVLGETS
jgi:hypothetical protein